MFLLPGASLSLCHLPPLSKGYMADWRPVLHMSHWSGLAGIMWESLAGVCSSLPGPPMCCSPNALPLLAFMPQELIHSLHVSAKMTPWRPSPLWTYAPPQGLTERIQGAKATPQTPARSGRSPLSIFCQGLQTASRQDLKAMAGSSFLCHTPLNSLSPKECPV